MSSTPSLPDDENTLLNTFLAVARNSCKTENPVLECGADYWTYGELDTVSSGLALQIHKKYGLHPTVAIISENHPYMLAILLATWKLSGIFVPLDCHAPLDMVKKMLENVEATCAVIPAEELGLSEMLKGTDTGVITFPKDTTIITLTQRFLDQDAELSPSFFPPPTPSSLALYLHTSSASSISNLKCVPLTHGVISTGSQSCLSQMSRAWPSVNFDKLKVLGLSPWTHVMAISHDIGGAAFGSAGCLTMGVLPSAYPNEDDRERGSIFGKAEHEMDVLDRLLETALRSQPDVFVCVPWVLEGFRERYERLLQQKMESEALRVKEVLQKVKSFGVAGAAMTPELLLWACEMKINVSSNVGMTELGGPLFHTRIDHEKKIDEGWPSDECLISDAELILVNDEGQEDAHEGELYVISRRIGKGYLKYDSSAFRIAPDGMVTFKTGDIYQRSATDRYSWKGRREDYIQMISSETLDPRPIEGILNACPAVAHSCVVGNNFMKKPSDVVCILIQPTSPTALNSKELAEITRAVAAINKTLLPPLRIAWSRVGILESGMTIPYTRKHAVFRKKLEEVFGDFLARLLQRDGKIGLETVASDIVADVIPIQESMTFPSSNLNKTSVSPLAAIPDHADATVHQKVEAHVVTPVPDISVTNSIKWTTGEVKRSIMEAVADILGLKIEALRNSLDTSFAELGMDSNMAVRIVNRLNKIFGLQFPLNACHNLVDLSKLSEAALVELGLIEGTKKIQIQQKDIVLSENEEIVIVGQAVRLPGDINTPESFWEALINKRDDIMVPIPAERWDHSSFYRSPSSISPSKICDISFEKAGFVDVAHYDNNFFGISSPEALYIGPATRLTLETVFEAFENACIPISKVKGSKMGVFVAANLDEGYTQILLQDKGFDAYGRYYGTGMATSTVAGRISYLLDIHGPSSVTDTACSSGLVVLDQAVKYIQSRDGESAIVTAVNTKLWPGSFGFLSAQKMASPNSRCATFTNEADGAAIRDGDAILAVVKSTDVMHGGRTQGLVAPSVSTQIALQESLLKKAGLTPSQIDFLETHGTGTSLGDLIEIQGINEAFQGSHATHPLILGAAKTCIGHTGVAAGLVGLLKAIGTFQDAVVPGLVHLTPENMNPSIDCEIVPISIPTEAVPLPHKPSNDPYRGLILANGFAGTIAGAIVEDPKGLRVDLPPNLGDSPTHEKVLMPFVISAKTINGLEEYLKEYLCFCRKAEASHFRNICYTSCVGREHYRYRFACAVADMSELIHCLEKGILSFSHKSYKNINANRITFAFPGQGSQYQGMASCLAELYPDFADTLTFNGSTAAEVSRLPVLSFLLDRQPSSDLTIDDSEVAQICIFVYQYSMSLWLKTLGLEPCAVMGHSLGEITAAVLAGALSYEVGLELVVKRSKLLRSDPTRPGGMAIIAASAEAVNQLIHHLSLNGRLVIAVYSDPSSHVVSGELSAVDVFLSNAKMQGLRGAKLNISQGFHSPLIYSGLAALQEWSTNNQPYFSRLKIPLYSTTYGSEISADARLRSSHWVEHARDPVRLSDAVENIASNDSIDVILDIGPQPFIWAAMQTMPSKKLAFALTAKGANDQHKAYLGAILALFEHGSTLDFEKLFSRSPLQGKRMPLPTYPFQRQRHYPNSIPSRDNSKIASKALASSHESSKRLVQFNVDQALYDMLLDHQIEGRRIAPGASLVDFFATRTMSRSIKTITFHSPLVIASPSLEINGEIDASGRFFLYEGSSKTNQVCSGVVSPKPTFPLRKSGSDLPPEHTKFQAEVYENNRVVQLGRSFRNIQSIRTWPTHADVLIAVKSTHYPVYDRIRKIDCCLHAFGAVVQKEVPRLLDLKGSFLPASLDDFTLHSDDLPESFICRYHLPFDVTRNYRVVSIAFDVFSLSGDLLISCRKYSVAWIPVGVAIQGKVGNAPVSKAHERTWLQQDWISEDSSASDESLNQRYDQLLYIALHGANLNVCQPLSAFADKTIALILLDEQIDKQLAGPNLAETPGINAQIESALQELKGSTTFVAFDLTSTGGIPTSDACSLAHRSILRCMKSLSKRKVTISNCLFLSEMSVPVTYSIGTESKVETAQCSSDLSTVAALIQGMARVFRREMGLDLQLWALDLPPLASVGESTFRDIVHRELAGRQNTLSRMANVDRTVAYRTGRDARLGRFVPVLRVVDAKFETPQACSGIALVVGMGSIGAALAAALISDGCSEVMFIGRRPAHDQEIVETVRQLCSDTNGKVSYCQADVCDLESLRSCVVDIQSRYGPIEHIIHTAAVISDATIQTVKEESFERVLHPKVTGAWNLHLLSRELCSSLKSFALLSSISVSLGNQGQVAYVAGNSFMEVLAAHRLSHDLPATALQLGPWESRLTENLDVPNTLVPIMTNKIGIPLILKAMSRREAVQVIAYLNTERLAEISAYTQDPLFQEILLSAPQRTPGRRQYTRAEVSSIMVKILRDILELKTSEQLELTDSLVSCGIDSISFAQIRGMIVNDLEVEVPVMFLSESFIIREMIDHVVEHHRYHS